VVSRRFFTAASNDGIYVQGSNTLFIRKNATKKIQVSPVFTGNMIQDLTQLRETADNTERYV
jgi:hypothetical protein